MKVMHIGGQESVTITLANSFVSHGHHVTIASFEKPWEDAVKRSSPSVRFYTLGAFKKTKSNVERLNKILCEEKIDVVINQWGLPYVPTVVLNAAIKMGGDIKPTIKTIAVYHNDPETNARIKDVEIALEKCRNPLKCFALNLKKRLFAKITGRSMKYVYEHCDQYQVLSQSHIAHFEKFTGVKCANHIFVQANPLTINSEGFYYNSLEKEKEIVYCGRIDYNQKRVFRIIEMWTLLEPKFPDWKLTIVGGGDAKKDIEQLTESLNLRQVHFEGFQNPINYYKRASILVLTSEYEGFGLVIIEGMSFGVVPCVYDSYSALRDIIADDLDGQIVKKENGRFSAKEMANRLAEIMTDERKLNSMAKRAIETSKKYSIENVYRQWMSNLNRLLQL